jgi:predicted MFS family arabinose efflux permease
LGPFRALRHRNFRVFFLGQLTSLTGTWMQNVAQSWLVYRLTHSELLLGTAGFLAHLPTLALGTVGGVVADRYNRRKIVLLTQTLFLLQSATLAALTLAGLVTTAHVLALALFGGLVDAFDRPARQAMLVNLAAKDDLLSAISLNSLMFNAARVLGPSIGGIAVAALGEGVCFTINSISFLAVLASLLALRLPPEPRPPTLADPLRHLIDGFRYAWRTRDAAALLGLNAVVNLAVAPVWVLLPVFSDSTFHRGAAGVGLLTASMGAGAVIGMIGLASRGHQRGLLGVIFASGLTLAFAQAIFAASTVFALSAAAMALIGFGVMRMNGAINTELQTHVPEEMRGRMMGLFATANVGVIPIGSLGGGALAQAFGAPTVVAGGALICAIAAVAFHLTRRP